MDLHTPPPPHLAESWAPLVSAPPMSGGYVVSKHSGTGHPVNRQSCA
jgi:hypothetical protein